MELRKAVRYRLDLPVTYRWTGPSGRARLGMGFTRDISSAAMFVLCDHCPPADAVVSCEVMLSRPQSQGYCQIIASGRVLRTEKNDQRRVFGFALLGNMLMLNSEIFDALEQGLQGSSLSGKCTLDN